MPVVINATPGHASANSYLSLAEAETYFESRLHGTVWAAATPDNKNRSLVWATRLIDATVRFTGSRTTTTQALEWPRTGMSDLSAIPVSDTIIPQRIKDVTAELALLLLTSDRTKELEQSLQGLTSLRAGPVTLGFKDNIEMQKAVPDTLRSMLVPSWVWRREPWPLVV